MEIFEIVDEEVESPVIMREIRDTPPVRAVPVPVAQTEAIASVEFDIQTPYTIPSRNEVTVVEMAHFSLPAEFEYIAIPKIDRDAFLLAHIVGWEQYNLLAGEANIFFENTFVGTTILDTRQLTDTLTISLGRDRSVVVRREPVREF
jgi:hypothetical protein